LKLTNGVLICRTCEVDFPLLLAAAPLKYQHGYLGTQSVHGFSAAFSGGPIEVGLRPSDLAVRPSNFPLLLAAAPLK